MNFQIHFDIPFYLFLLFGAISATLSYLMYRNLETVSRPRQIFLAFLRGLSLFLLFLAMTNLVTDLVRFSFEKKNVFLLIDNSKSMSLKDGTMPRPEVVRNLLNSTELDTLGHYFDVKPIVFGGSVLPEAKLDSLRYDRPATDITAAVEEASKLSGNGRTAFGLLVSDGNYNTGGSPVEAARNLTFPMFTVGIGDSNVPKDVVAKQVIPAPVMYAGKKSVVKAIIGSNGYGSVLVTAHLLDDGKEVDAKNVTLPENGDVEVSFEYTPAKVGVHVLRVYVPAISGEFSKRNNAASVSVDVLKGKYSLLLVAGEPATDVAFLRRNVEESGDFDLKVIVQKTGSSFYENDAASILSGKYDAAILYDFPNKESSATMRDVAALLSANDIPYLYFAGSGFSPARIAGLPRLPFSVTGYQAGEYPIGILPSPDEALPATLQPIYTLVEAGYSKFPPLYYQRIQCIPAAGAVTIASPVMNGVNLKVPVLLIDPHERSAAFLAYGLWRLQLMSPLSGLGSDYLQDFLTTLMRTLISGGKQKLLAVHTDKNVYDPSERVRFNAVLVGQNGAPVDDASVDVNIRDRSGHIASDIRLSSRGSGGYAGSVAGLGAGKYTFLARANSGSTFLGADSGNVIVEPLNTEFVRTAMNAALLRQLASVSGGSFLTPSQFEEGAFHIKEGWKKPTRLSDSTRFELLSSLPVLALVFLLLAVEWTLRKVWGLP